MHRRNKLYIPFIALIIITCISCGSATPSPTLTPRPTSTPRPTQTPTLTPIPTPTQIPTATVIRETAGGLAKLLVVSVLLLLTIFPVYVSIQVARGRLSKEFVGQQQAFLTAALAGILAGVLLFGVFLIWRSDLNGLYDTVLSALPKSGLVPLFGHILALLAGIAIAVYLIRKVGGSPVMRRRIGIVNLFLTAASTTALYSFVSDDESEGIITYLSLGIALGILLYVLWHPSAMKYWLYKEIGED
ncbi:MAG TPA: hypothetical protein VJG32_00400 [Anaerolineae bacterium]|nr:hypothetical protein [Anaerolineae bacterium]